MKFRGTRKCPLIMSKIHGKIKGDREIFHENIYGLRPVRLVKTHVLLHFT